MAVRLWKFAVSYSVWCLLLLLTFGHSASGLEISDAKVVGDSAGNSLENRRLPTETVFTGVLELPATSGAPPGRTESSVASFAVPTNVPSVNDFIRRVYSRVAVVRDYIYLDSGELAQKHVANKLIPVNGTLAIDLRTAWRPEEVDIVNNEYGPNGKQVLLNAAIMVDESEGSIYTWGGRTSHQERIRDPSELWKFQPTGEGRGEWTDATPSGSDFADLKRFQDAAVASTPGKAFIFGGWSSQWTTIDPVSSIRGFATFDFKTKEWERHTSGPYSDDNFIVGGSAIFAPNFGTNGLIFVMGGVKDQDAKGTETSDYISFETIHFLDPATMDWHQQNTTSESLPPMRRDFCAVGAAVGEDGFDIFVYGGNNGPSAIEYSDVYVLSLPGFHWTKAPEDSNLNRPRCNHACAVIGQRHLMSWGGWRRGTGSEAALSLAEIDDNFPQGIGLFDMSKLEWTERYDPSAGKYERHKTIAEWYQEGGGASTMKWTSSDIKALFIKGDDDAGNGPPIGPIAGGVVGGVAVIGAIVGTLWFLRRRKRRRVEQAGVDAVPDDVASPPPAEVANNQWKSGTQGYKDYPVNTGTEQPSELHAGSPNYQQPSEMDGTGFYQQGR